MTIDHEIQSIMDNNTSVLKIVFCFSLYLCITLGTVQGACQKYDWPTATAITANGSFQYIESNNYPNEYEDDQKCAWHVTAGSKESRIIIYVMDFSTEGAKTPCSKDYATIFDGDSTAADEIFRVCPATSNERKVYISSSNQIYVTFKADAFLHYSGFRLAVFTNDTSNQPDCNSTLTVTSTPQYLLSNNLAYPYVPNYECIHTFELESNTSNNGIQFYFYFMDIESSPSCTVASLSIAAGTDDSLQTVYKLCETADNFTERGYRVKGVIAEFNFTTSNNTNLTVDYYGYFITYQTDFVGLYLSQPDYNALVNITVSEVKQLGHLDITNGIILANATGNLVITMLENGFAGTTFSYDNSSAPLYYITLANILDFETTAYYNLTVLLASDDSPAPEDTATVYFNITLVDADDIAPVFVNLPYHFELLRSTKSGTLLYTLNATDADATANYTVVVYGFQSEPNNFFTINATTGEIRLAIDADTIAIGITNYEVTAIAYSGSTSSSLQTTGLINVTIPPDSPPICTHTHVISETITAPKAVAGTISQYVTSWNCTDEYVVTYFLGTVSPTVRTQLFSVDNATASISLVRSFTVDEVPDRIFYLEIIAVDTINQTTNFTAQVNVTDIACYPNPRKLYARMDDSIGTVVLYDFNCTTTVGMSYTLTQFPENIFNVTYEPDGPASIVLLAQVYKIKYYSLSVFMTNGLDKQRLNFEVIVQFERCGLNSASGLSFMTVLIACLSLIYCFLS